MNRWIYRHVRRPVARWRLRKKADARRVARWRDLAQRREFARPFMVALMVELVLSPQRAAGMTNSEIAADWAERYRRLMAGEADALFMHEEMNDA